MDVLGIEPATRSYRVSVTRKGGPLVGLVPESMIGALAKHQDAYEWLARHAAKIEAALDTLAAGQSPCPPYDQLRLAEET
ncbi:MAG: hypothetical protein AAGH17_01470 [Pseudomonadota bacterium]